MTEKVIIDNNFGDIVIEEKFIPTDPPRDNHNDNDNDNDGNHEEMKKLPKSYFKCKCFRLFALEGKYRAHAKICPIVNENSIVCRNFRCYQKFSNQGDFEKHVRNGDCQNQKNKRKLEKNRFECYYDGCGSKFPTQEKLKWHRYLVHLPNAYICLYCDKTFKLVYEKLAHQKSHHKTVKISSSKSKKGKNSSINSKSQQNLRKSLVPKPYAFEQIPQIKQEIDQDLAQKSPFQKLDHHNKTVKKSSSKSPNVKARGKISISKPPLFEQEIDQDLPRRITRSQSKKANYSKFFDSDDEKVDQNPAKDYENDGDTSTTASLSSFIDSDDDSNGILANKRVKNSSKSLKSKKVNKSTTIQNQKPFVQDSGTNLTRRVTRSRGKTFDSINSNTNEEKVDTNSTKYAETVNKSSKSKSPNVKKSIIPILKSPLLEQIQIPQIKQEIDQDLTRRITKSPSKKQNYSKFFDSVDEEKGGENFTKDYEDDGDSDSDSSTTGSSRSFIDSDDDYNEIPAKNVKTSHQNVDSKLSESGESGEYLCFKCRESFTTKLAVRHHEKNCQKNDRKLVLEVKCEFEDCTKIFSNVKLYNYHLDQVHYRYIRNRVMKTKKLLVKKEPKPETTETHFKNGNVRIKKEGYRYYRCCRLCHKYFKSKNDLKNHQLAGHKIHCTRDNCSMVFVEQTHLDYHIRFKHFEQDKKHECTLCDKRFIGVYNLKCHMGKVHHKKMKVCPFCSDELSHFKFQRHLKRHKVDGRGKVFCKICQIFVTSYSKLEKHNITEYHLKKMNIKTEVKLELKTDTDETPSEEFILPDEVNIDTYLILNNIKSERKVNEGIVNDKSEVSEKGQKRISTCSDCGLKFRSSEFRQKHQVKFHGYEKQIFYCDICDATFEKKCTLDVHLKKSRAHKVNVEKKVLNT